MKPFSIPATGGTVEINDDLKLHVHYAAGKIHFRVEQKPRNTVKYRVEAEQPVRKISTR